ncbi:MAG: hypothetical protein AAFX40_00750, partial [Cyanobacteria bacterium J06639_1]
MSKVNWSVKIVSSVCFAFILSGVNPVNPHNRTNQRAFGQENEIKTFSGREPQDFEILYEFGVSDNYSVPLKILHQSGDKIYGTAKTNWEDEQALFEFQLNSGIEELYQFQNTNEWFAFPASSQPHLRRSLYFANPAYICD